MKAADFSGERAVSSMAPLFRSVSRSSRAAERAFFRSGLSARNAASPAILLVNSSSAASGSPGTMP